MSEDKIITPLLVIKSTNSVRLKKEYDGILGLLDCKSDYQFILSSFKSGEIISVIFLMRADNKPVLEDNKNFHISSGQDYNLFVESCLRLFNVPLEHDILNFDNRPYAESEFYSVIEEWSKNV